MNTANVPLAQLIARAARASEQERTGHAPLGVTVVLGEEILVIAVNGALSPAERALARTVTGAAEIRDFRRQLFASSSAGLRGEITRITGLQVTEAMTEVDAATGGAVHGFTSGTVVQVFLLAGSLPAGACSESEPAGQP